MNKNLSPYQLHLLHIIAKAPGISADKLPPGTHPEERAEALLVFKEEDNFFVTAHLGGYRITSNGETIINAGFMELVEASA